MQRSARKLGWCTVRSFLSRRVKETGIFSKGVWSFLQGFPAIHSMSLFLLWFVLGATLWGWLSPPFRPPAWFVFGTRLWGGLHLRSGHPPKSCGRQTVGVGIHLRSRGPYWDLLLTQSRVLTGEHSSRRRYIHIDPVSALSPVSFSNFHLSLHIIPSIFNALQDEFPGIHGILFL